MPGLAFQDGEHAGNFFFQKDEAPFLPDRFSNPSTHPAGVEGPLFLPWIRSDRGELDARHPHDVAVDLRTKFEDDFQSEGRSARVTICLLAVRAKGPFFPFVSDHGDPPSCSGERLMAAPLDRLLSSCSADQGCTIAQLPAAMTLEAEAR